MPVYTPNNFDNTNPTDAVVAETAQAEFRNIKSFFQGVLYRAAGSKNINNTIAPTTVLDADVPANSLGINHILKAEFTGYIYNSTGTNQSVVFIFTYGGTTLTTVTAVWPVGNYAYRYTALITNNNVTNIQESYTELVYGGTDSSNGVAILGGTLSANGESCTIDSTQDQQLIVTATLNTASASFGVYVNIAYVEWK